MSNIPIPSPAAASTPAGWYPDGQGRMRWWDGTAWTEQFAPAAGTPSVGVMVVRPTNGLAIASMVIGIVAAALSFTIILIFIAMPLGVVALVLGIVALLMAKNIGAGVGPAWTGMVLGVVPFIIYFSIVATVSGFVSR